MMILLVAAFAASGRAQNLSSSMVMCLPRRFSQRHAAARVGAPMVDGMVAKW
jgi:hypothetical protein